MKLEEINCISEEVLTRAVRGEVFVIRRNPAMLDLVRRVRLRLASLGRPFLRTDSTPDDIEQRLGDLSLDDLTAFHRRVNQSFEKWPVGAWHVAAVLSDGLVGTLMVQKARAPRVVPPSVDWKVWMSHAPPHKDSWYRYPSQTVNLWLACSPTRGCGLLLYGDTLGKELPHFTPEESADFRGVTLRNSALLESLPAYSIEPDQGDAVVFCTDHLHGSTVNSTARVRISIDYRIVDKRIHNSRPEEFISGNLVSRIPKFAGPVIASRNRVSSTIVRALNRIA